MDHLCFETAIDMFAKQLEIPHRVHKAFLKDADLLSKFINQALAERKSMFAGSFTNLPETASYICDNVIDVPDRFNCYLHLNLSCASVVELSKEEYIYLHPESKGADMSSRISSICLQKTLRDDLHNILKHQPRVKCQARTYELCFHTSIYPISAHTIVATQLRSTNNARIVFEFLLAMKYSMTKVLRPPSTPMPESMPRQKMSYWLALPVNHFDVNFNGQNHLGRVHVWQMATNAQRQGWRLAVRLSYMFNIINATLSTVGMHAIKHTCINLCEKYGLSKADKPISHKLIDILNAHGSNKLAEISAAQSSGCLVYFEAYPALSEDCMKTDVLLSKIHSKMHCGNTNGVYLDKFKVLFDLLKPKTIKKGSK